MSDSYVQMATHRFSPPDSRGELTCPRCDASARLGRDYRLVLIYRSAVRPLPPCDAATVERVHAEIRAEQRAAEVALAE